MKLGGSLGKVPETLKKKLVIKAQYFRSVSTFSKYIYNGLKFILLELN
jgi:hypothetical protein